MTITTIESNSTDWRIQELGHLGLVAGMTHELKIASIIDDLIPTGKTVSHGTAVCAMILNGLGFTNQQLYLIPHFFENKPLPRLLGVEIKADQLNDDTLGRTLDAVADYGVSELYSHLALSTVKHLQLSPPSTHLDSTSFHTDGKYNSEEEEQEGVVRITKGYSRDHRPDLNQIMLHLITESEASIPVHMQLASGNSNDQGQFQQIVSKHVGRLKESLGFAHFVADSALYNEKSIQALHRETYFITRVPATVAEVSVLIESHMDLVGFERIDDTYQVIEFCSTYGNVPQRWCLFRSKSAVERSTKTIRRQWSKGSETEVRRGQRLQREEFACFDDAQQSLLRFQESLHYSSVVSAEIVEQIKYARRGRPIAGESSHQVVYRIQAALSSSLESFRNLVNKQGFFVLSTNDLRYEELPPEEILREYKNQSKSEAGFRFLKSPEFFASSFFVHTPKRLMALLFVMTLCLMVYAALQYKIRQALEASQQTVPNQVGKPTNKPTARWIFHLFNKIHVLLIPQQAPLVLNTTPMHHLIIQLLGYEHYYF